MCYITLKFVVLCKQTTQIIKLSDCCMETHIFSVTTVKRLISCRIMSVKKSSLLKFSARNL
jgi:hypothetical protein